MPSSSATVAPFASSVSTCACARGGSVTCEPSEKRSDSGAESAATRRSPTAPVRPAPAPSTANESGVGRITKNRDAGRTRGRTQQRQPPRPVRALRLPALFVQRLEPRLNLRQQLPPARVALNRARNVAHQRFDIYSFWVSHLPPCVSRSRSAG